MTNNALPAFRRLNAPLLLGTLSLGLAACVTPNGPNNVSAQCVGTAATVRAATVNSYRPVTIQGKDHGIGAIGGAAVGGLAGSQVGGRNSTQAIGAIGGAVLGGLAGNAVGKAATRSNGLAYVLKFENGEIREVIQGGASPIAPGSPVNVSFGQCGTIVTPA